MRELELQELADVPVSTSAQTSIEKDGKIYMFGGSRGTSELKLLQIYDVSTNKWSNGEPLPLGLEYPALELIGDNVYVIGGYHRPGQIVSQKVFIYNISTNTWKNGSDLPEKFPFPECFSYNSEIYIFGGVNIKSAYKYEIATDKWVKLPDLPKYICTYKPIKIGNKIYFVGGSEGYLHSSVPSKNIQIYNLDNGEWTKSTSVLPYNSHLTLHRVNLYNEKIYIVAGRDSGKIQDRILVYNYIEDKWEEELKLPIKMMSHSSHVIGNRLYLFYGNKTYVTEIGEAKEPEEELDHIHVLLEKGEQTLLSLSQDLSVNLDYNWSSGDAGVATADMAGTVSAQDIGKTRIYAERSDGTYKQHIHVKVVEVGEGDKHRLAVDLNVNETEQLYLSDDPNVVWASFDPLTATVNVDGRVRAIKKGLAVIEAFLDGKKHYIYVRVRG